MPVSCSALNCTNRFKKGSGITFHRFPLSKPDLLSKWLTAIGRENWMPSPKACICSVHFTEQCFEERNDRRFLRFLAVPTLFPSNGEAGCGRIKPGKRKAEAASSSFPFSFTGPREHLLASKNVLQLDHAVQETSTGASTVILVNKRSPGSEHVVQAETVLNLAHIPQDSNVILDLESEAVLPCRKWFVTSSTFTNLKPLGTSTGNQLLGEALQRHTVVLDSGSLPVSKKAIPFSQLLNEAVEAVFINKEDIGTTDGKSYSGDNSYLSSVGPTIYSGLPDGSTCIASEQSIVVSDKQEQLTVLVDSAEDSASLTETDHSLSPGLVTPGVGVIQDHSYGMAPCTDFIRTLQGKLELEKVKNEEHQHTIKLLKQKLKKKEHKIAHLANIIKRLQGGQGSVVNDVQIQLTDCSL